MGYLKLKRNGIFELFDNEDKSRNIVPKKDLSHCLAMDLRLEDDITLEEVLNAAPGMYEFIPWKFDEHLKEMAKPFKASIHKTPQQIEYLELYQYIFINNNKKGALSSIEVYPMVHGVGFPDTKGERIPYGIDLSPTYKLKHYPFRIAHTNKAFIQAGKKMKTVSGVAGDFEYNPTLLEVYTRIVHELTWYGSPKQRDAFVAELGRRLKDTK
jgi:hypothetical protein